MGSAIISTIERDSAEGGPNRALRLRNLLLEDKELAPDLVSGISDQEARPFAKALYDSSVLPDLDRNLLLANMMKVHPSLQEIALTRRSGKEKQRGGRKHRKKYPQDSESQGYHSEYCKKPPHMQMASLM